VLTVNSQNTSFSKIFPNETYMSVRDPRNNIPSEDLLFLNSVKKEGWLYKKTSSIFLGWQKRFVKLSFPRIYYAKSWDEFISKRKLRCINLLVQKIAITEENGIYFNLSIAGAKRKLILKAENITECHEWKQCIQSMINYANATVTPGLYKYLPGERPWDMDQITEAEFLKNCKNGDILLFQTDNMRAKFQRSFTFSNYDHVGMILNITGTIYLFDANGNRGVAMTTWDDFIQLKEYKKIWKNCISKIGFQRTKSRSRK